MKRLLIAMRRTLLDLRRQAGTTLITVSTVAVVFWLLGLLELMAVNIERLAGALEENFRLSVFLRADCLESCRERLVTEAQSLEETQAVEFIGKDQAWARYRQQSGLELERLLEENPFPQMLEVKPKSAEPERLQGLAQRLGALEGVEEVVYGQRWLAKYIRLKQLVRWLGLVLAGMVFLASAVIIANTARLLALARREEIEILELVGASRLFISGPLYLQGMLMGLTGAAAGLGLTWLVFLLAGPWLADLAELQLVFIGSTLAELLVGCGGLMGLLGTAFSVRR
jgi:cell division transport system permease protein